MANQRLTNEDIESLHVSLPQMLDLALGTPEVGAMNMNILHNFLHVLLHQVNLRATKVEYRGEDANRIKTMVSSLKSGPSLHLHEYSITDGSGKRRHRIQSTDRITVNVDVYTNETEEEIEKPAEMMSATATAREKETIETVKRTKGMRQEIGPETESEGETVIFVEPVVDGATPTALRFKQLEESVNQLQRQFQALEEVSSPELIERVKGKVTDPLSDMWNIININKRLDATEQGVDKLATMLQDVIKGEFRVPEETSDYDDRLKQIEDNLSNIEKSIANLEIIAAAAIEEPVQTPVQTSAQESADTPEPAPENTETAVVTTATGTTNEIERDENETKEKTSERPARRSLPCGIDLVQMHNDVSALKTEIANMRKDVYDIHEKIDRIPERETRKETVPTVEPENVPPVSSVVEERKEDPRLAECLDAMENIEGMYGDVINELNERIRVLETEVSSLNQKLENAPMAGLGGEGDVNELVSKIHEIQSDMERLNKTADRLIDEKETRDLHVNALLEQIELLKAIKADKETLEDALADKADAHVLNRKVSHDQFDAACDDLARGLEEAVSKLGKQESIWQQALDEVQREISSKVDKIEMTPLKDFVNHRLKSLQEKLKNVVEMRREDEAAGTKKLLKDVQCISCDKNVVMKTEEVSRFRSEPLPCTMSMKPYLTYELDQVRKQQKRLPLSRNMIQFEAAMQEESKKLKAAREEMLAKTPRDHLCNRYCGGSHTVTTPQQRVMRVGHFLTQWGPKTVQLTEGMIKGTDGQLYRGRPMPGKIDVCGPTCETITEEIRPPERSARKASYPRKSSAGSQKRSSKRLSVEPVVSEAPIEPVPEPVTEVPPLEQYPEAEEEVLPIDPTAHTDEIVRNENEYEVEQAFG